MTIGRGREAKLTLAHALVSRIHCELYEVDGVLCIRDLGSLNGTYVGDVRVTEAALESGDILSVGAFQFELIIEEGKPSPPSIPDGGQSDVRLAVEEEEATESVEPASKAPLEPEENDDSPPLMPPGISTSATEVDELVEDVPEFVELTADESGELTADESGEIMEVEAIEEEDDVVEVEAIDEDDEPPAPEAKIAPTVAAPRKATEPQAAPRRSVTPPAAKPSQPAEKTETDAAPSPAKDGNRKGPDGDFSFLDADKGDAQDANAASNTDLNEFLKGL